MALKTPFVNLSDFVNLVTIVSVLALILPFTCYCAVLEPNDTTTDPTPAQNASAHWVLDPERAANVPKDHTPKLMDKCDYRMYVDFFKLVAEDRDSLTPYNKAVGNKYKDHPEATNANPKIMNPKYLCIRTDSAKNIDINEFDCLPDKLDIHQVKGYCGCGSRSSKIDFNDNRSYIGLNDISHSYEYFELLGLNKFLVIDKNEQGDDFECVAQKFGHCTLEVNKKRKNWKITHCQKGFKCRNVSSYSVTKKSPILNVHTGEWYGLCISENTPDKLKDPHGCSVQESVSFIALFMGIMMIILLTCGQTYYL